MVIGGLEHEGVVDDIEQMSSEKLKQNIDELFEEIANKIDNLGLRKQAEKKAYKALSRINSSNYLGIKFNRSDRDEGVPDPPATLTPEAKRQEFFIGILIAQIYYGVGRLYDAASQLKQESVLESASDYAPEDEDNIARLINLLLRLNTLEVVEHQNR